MRVLPMIGSPYYARINNLKSDTQGSQQTPSVTAPSTPSFKQGGTAVAVLCGTMLSSLAVLMGATAIGTKGALSSNKILKLFSKL